VIQLVANGLVKRYGATRALTGLNMQLSSGEIAGIAGPNGAGKSTLMRMLAGEESADSGNITLHRQQGSVHKDVWRHVAVVHQEPQVWPNMTVRENLVVGREGSRVSRSLRSKSVIAAMEKLEILAFADYQLADLSLAVRQRVEIARAILCDADVFLFDEPNSALTDDESSALFETMGKLAAENKIVLLITHRLSDFVRYCRRVFVLRDGMIHSVLEGEQLCEATIANRLTDSAASHSRVVDRNAARTEKTHHANTAPLTVDGWTDADDLFRDVTLTLDVGQVIAFAGVEGSGARELAQAIGGRRKVLIQGRRAVYATDNNDSIPVSYLAANRRDTVFANMSVGENMLARMGWRELSGPLPLWSPAKARNAAAAAIRRYRVKAGGSADPITSLSGGNQQKVVLGAAMELGAAILVVEEPTRGVDIASSADVYRLIRAYASADKLVILYCTEPREIYDVADEVVVFAQGRVAGRLELTRVPDVVALAERIAELQSGR
jgi:ABC-type sugar transport system ATPase subunit